MTKTLLHIDDDPAFTDLLSCRLAQHGWKVETLNDPTLWCESLSDHRIVLLDMNMPNYPGIEVLQDIKRFDAKVQVIVITGVCKLTTVISCLSLGAEYCLFKPLEDFEDLLDIVERTWFRIHHWKNAAAFTASERAAARTMLG